MRPIALLRIFTLVYGCSLCITSLVLHTRTKLVLKGIPSPGCWRGPYDVGFGHRRNLCHTKNFKSAVRMGRFEQLSAQMDDDQGIMQRNSRCVSLGGFNDLKNSGILTILGCLQVDLIAINPETHQSNATLCSDPVSHRCLIQNKRRGTTRA